MTLHDERTFQATLVGGDSFTDLAVLKIEGKNLPVVPLGDSARLAVSETVVAIGSPLWVALLGRCHTLELDKEKGEGP